MTTLLSETFTGTNGANWNATNWDYKYFQFGGTGTIQSGKGQLVTGAIGSGQDYGAYRSASSFTDFRLTVDYTVSGTSTSGSYLAFGFRSSSTWISGQMIGDACYWVELTRGGTPAFALKKRLSGTTTTLGTTTTTYTAADVVHIKVIANGSSIKVWFWKNSDTQPTDPTFAVIDTAHTSGKFFVSVYGGTDTATETFTVDDFVVDDVLTEGGSSPAAGSPNSTGTAYNPSVSAVDGATPTLMSETWDGTSGSWPAQWTTTTSGTGTVADIQSNKGRMATGTAVYGKVGARNTDALAGDDYTLTVDIVIPTYTEWYFFVHVRGSSSFNNTYQLLSSYQFRFTSYLSATVVELYEVNGSGTATLAAAGTMTGAPIAGDTVRIKVEVADATDVQLKQKAWIVGAAEPGYTDLSSAVTTDYTGDYVALSCQGGNNTTSEDFLWDNFTVTTADDGIVDAEVAVGVGSVGTPNPSVTGLINAQLASSHGEALFDGAGESYTLTIEALDAVSGHGEAHGAQRQHDAAAASGAGTAYDATVTVSGNTSAAAVVAASAGLGNDVTAIRTGTAEPTHATGTGTAYAATTSTTTGTTNASAQTATATADATGITYLLDELGEVIRDENGEGIGDGAGLTVLITHTVEALTEAGAAHTPQIAIKASAVSAASAASVSDPSITTDAGGAGTTNVNPSTAGAVGAALEASSLVSLGATEAASAGAAETPQTDIPAHAGLATSVGVAYDWDPASATPAAVSAGAAYDAQIDVLSGNFVATAPIPIFASAADPSIAVAVYPDAITVAATAHSANQSSDIPGQLITIRDRGHTVTMKER